jgi:L-fuculose-phosphate aldolase
MKYMPERKLICALGKKLWEKGWVAGNDGNLSMRCDKDRFLITPTGVSKGDLTPDMILLVDSDGEKLDDGSPWEVTSELSLHLMCYQTRPDIKGVCHAHSPAATAFACRRTGIDTTCLSEAHMSFGTIPCAPYARTGTTALANAVAPLVKKHDAVLMANHGAITVGKSLNEAYLTMERLEHTALIGIYTAQLGGGVPLSEEEQKALRG